MRLREVNCERCTRYDDFGYEAIFECSREEASTLASRGVRNEYKAVMCSEPVVSSYNYCAKPQKHAKVIFSDPATILFVGDKKYISKAHDEKFDPEKGLLMCLAKANGISHLDLKRMLKGAEYQKLPLKEQKSINGVSVKIEKLELAKKKGRPRKTK